MSKVEKEHLNDMKEILPNSVSYQYNESLWTDFRDYLVNEGQRKHSVRNKVGYARRFYHVL